MRVGLTYDLRADYLAEGFNEDEVAEFDRADTIDHLESALRSLGHEPVRIGRAGRLIERLVAGERWDLVLNIAEGISGFGREALVPALLEAHAIPYTFSDPLVCALALHKAMAKRVLRDAGIPTPDFALVETPADLASVDLPYPLFAKPVAEGSSKGVGPASKVQDARELARTVRDLFARFRQPVLVETFLPGRELTVGILGTGAKARALGALEVRLLGTAEPEIYSYANKEDCEIHVAYELATGAIADEACELALAAWRALGARDGGRVDVRADAAGKLSVLEANPLPGLHPEHSDLPILCTKLGIPYRDLIGQIVASAAERMPSGRSSGASSEASAARHRPTGAPCTS